MMARFSVLVLVLVAVLSVEAKKPKRRRGESREQDTAIEELQQKVADLEKRVDSMGSSGSAVGTCPSASPIHMHFHGEGEEVDHGDHHDTHVHIDLGLGLDEFHGFHKFHKRMHKHLDPEEEYSAKCVMRPVDPSSHPLLMGELEFEQHGKDRTVTVSAEFTELPEANTHYPLHVHVKADMSGGCSKLGPHYDPFDPDVDVGDLGGVTSDSDKTVDHDFTGVRLSLFGPLSIVGRSVIIHDTAGDPMACCVIGWEHSPHDITDSHDDDEGNVHGPGHGHHHGDKMQA